MAKYEERAASAKSRGNIQESRKWSRLAAEAKTHIGQLKSIIQALNNGQVSDD